MIHFRSNIYSTNRGGGLYQIYKPEAKPSVSGLDKRRFFSKKNLFSFINKRRFFSNKRGFSEFENSGFYTIHSILE